MPKLPAAKFDTLAQFLAHDRHVLRFYGYWDDRDHLFGDVRDMVLLYHLADDTIEVQERLPPNSGRDKIPFFLRRIRVPKEVPHPKRHGEEIKNNHTVLNIFARNYFEGHLINDRLRVGTSRIMSLMTGSW